jgi:PAS domain S-box-containing protein
MARELASVDAESIVNTIREAVIVLNSELRVVSANQFFYDQFRVDPAETEGYLIFELGNHQWDIPSLRHLLESVIPGKTSIEGFEVRHRFEDIGERIMLLNARRVEREAGAGGLILLAIEDITSRYITQQKLAESETKYRKFVEEINSIIISIDNNGTITFFNHFAEELFGYNRNEVLGKPLVGNIIPCVDSKGRDNSRICQEIITDPQKYYANESEGVRRDGSRIVFSWSAKAERDASGEVTGILIDGNDITELSAAQKKLEENSAQLKNERDFVTAVLQTSGALIAVIDQDGKISRFNTACEELTGYTADEVLGHSVFDLFVPPEERDGVMAVAARLLAGETRVDFENNWLTRSGGKRYIRWRNSNLLDENGMPVYAVATGIDITDRKRAEDALRKSEEQFRNERDLLQQIVNNLPYSFVLYSPDLRLEYTNETVLKRYGYTFEQVQGKTVRELFSEEISDIFVPLLQNVRDTGKPFSGEVSYHVAGNLVTNIPNIVPLRNERNEIHHLIILSVDITDRKRMETALRDRTEGLIAANRDLESFSYSVSHDLRTPLTAIKGFSEILMKKYGALLDEHGRSILGHVITASDKITSIITDLISLARLSKETMNCQKTDLSQIAHSVIKELRQTEPHRNVIITVASSMPAWADPGFMSITLSNLIGNAWKYTLKNGDARIDIGRMTIGNENTFFVRDNGIGFDMNLAGRLFKPFQRLHSDNEFKGSGIGLAIVQKIIQRHGGKIWAESEPGKGTVFYFTLLTCAQ